MNLFIFAFSLGHSIQTIEDEPFVKSTKKKLQPYTTLFTIYLTLYNN